MHGTAPQERLKKIQRMLSRSLCRDRRSLSLAAARLKTQLVSNPADPALGRRIADLDARLAASVAIRSQRARASDGAMAYQ